MPGFSVQEVADRAGVSHRTVYRHFPTREALLEGLSDAVDQRILAQGGGEIPDEFDSLYGVVSLHYELFSRQARALEAAVRFGVGAAVETRGRKQRTERFREVLERGIDGITPEDAAMASTVIRHLAGSRSWLAMRESGLDAQAATETASWAVAVLLDALRDGRVPSNEAVTTANPKQETAP